VKKVKGNAAQFDKRFSQAFLRAYLKTGNMTNSEGFFV